MIGLLALALLAILVGLVCWMEAVSDLVDAGPMRGRGDNLRLGAGGLALIGGGFVVALTVWG